MEVDEQTSPDTPLGGAGVCPSPMKSIGAPLSVAHVHGIVQRVASGDPHLVVEAEVGMRHARASLGDSAFVTAVLGSCAAEQVEVQLVAATTAKNVFRTMAQSSGDCAPGQPRAGARQALMAALFASNGRVLKVLAEALRLELGNAKDSWPDLLPSVKHSLHSSTLASQQSADVFSRAEAVLETVHVMLKPFRYFKNPTAVREDAPQELEQIVGELMLSLQPTFTALVDAVVQPGGVAGADRMLHTICKCFHHTVQAYMPKSLKPTLLNWVGDVLRLLEAANTPEGLNADGAPFLARAVKRAVQVLLSLVTRHRRDVEPVMERITKAAIFQAKQSAGADTDCIDEGDDDNSMRDRTSALGFDLLSRLLEAGTGWKFLLPNLGPLLEHTVFPVLCMHEGDVDDWEADAEEYLAKNLPSDLDDSSGLREDFFTPRRSVLNFLYVLASSKGKPSEGPSTSNAGGKRKKGRDSKPAKSGKAVGELVLNFLQRYSLPPASDERTYYGVLLAYGALAGYLKEKQPAAVTSLVQKYVVPVYNAAEGTAPSPYLMANANWVLGEYAPLLSKTFSVQVYTALLSSVTLCDTDDVSCLPVRMSGMNSISALVQESVWPKDWGKVLSTLTQAACSEAEDEEVTRALSLMTGIAEAAEGEITPFVQPTVFALVNATTARIPLPPTPLPITVERALETLSALIESLDSTLEQADEDEEEEDASVVLAKQTSLAIVKPVSLLLQRSWLPSAWGVAAFEGDIPESARGEGARLLKALLERVDDPSAAALLHVSALSVAFAGFLSEWHAWEEEEDEHVIAIVDELCRAGQNSVLLSSDVDALSKPFTSFLCNVMTYGDAVQSARAARRVDGLLGIVWVCSGDSSKCLEAASAFAQSACERMVSMETVEWPLATALALAVASSLARSTVETSRALGQDALLTWLSAIASGLWNEERLCLMSELRLALVSVLRLLEVLGANGQPAFRSLAILSVLRTLVRMKEVANAVNEDDDEEDDEADEESGDDEALTDSDDEEEEEEETEEEFLHRYAAAAEEVAAEVGRDRDAGEIEDEEEELALQGVAMIKDEIGVFSEWMKMHTSSADLVAITNELTLHPVDGFDDARNLEEFTRSLASGWNAVIEILPDVVTSAAQTMNNMSL